MHAQEGDIRLYRRIVLFGKQLHEIPSIVLAEYACPYDLLLKFRALLRIRITRLERCLLPILRERLQNRFRIVRDRNSFRRGNYFK